MAQTKKNSKIKAKQKSAAKPKVKAKVTAKVTAKKVVKQATKQAAKLIKKAASKISGISTTKRTVVIPNSFKPLDDRLIVAVDAPAEKTAGGIIIPGNASERPSRGTVLAAGPGKRNKKGMLRPLDVIVGDQVIFPQFAGQKIEIGSDEFLILRENEILAIATA